VRDPFEAEKRSAAAAIREYRARRPLMPRRACAAIERNLSVTAARAPLTGKEMIAVID